MIIIYGMKICPYCDYIKPQIEGKEDEFRYIDIGEHIRNMREFMDIRDNRPEFDHSKEIGDVGIPCFVFENGRISLDPADVGLVEYSGESAACSIEDHKNGKQGC